MLLWQTQPPPPLFANGHQQAAVCPHSPLRTIIHVVLPSIRCNPWLLRRHHKGFLWLRNIRAVWWSSHDVRSSREVIKVVCLSGPHGHEDWFCNDQDFLHCWLPASTRMWMTGHELMVQDVPIWAVFYVSVVLERCRENVPRFTACQICRMCTLNCGAQTGLVDPGYIVPLEHIPTLCYMPYSCNTNTMNTRIATLWNLPPQHIVSSQTLRGFAGCSSQVQT